MKNRMFSRRGLTLIELVVVMAILVALAGILVPMLPKMLKRAHGASSATSTSELSKSIQTYHSLYFAYPDNYDSLTAADGTLNTYVPGGLTPVALTADTLASLNDAGIMSVRRMVASAGGDWSPTFYPYGNDSSVFPVADALTATDSLASLSPAVAAQQFGASADVDCTYVVFGVGSFTSMQGKVLQDAPIHFGEGANDSPGAVYARFGVVFQVTDAEGEALEKAQFIGAGAFHDGGFVSLGSHLAEYYGASNE